MTFPSWVAQYIGIPFEKYNCWQLVCKIYREQFNINLPNLDQEYHDPLDAKNIKKLYDRELSTNWVKKEIPAVGDAIVLLIKDQPWHVGIVISKDRMIHTENNLASVHEKFTGIMWKNKIVGFYRYEPRE